MCSLFNVHERSRTLFEIKYRTFVSMHLYYRWRNWVIRGIFSWVMILAFAFIVWLGPLALVTMVSL